jgi:hypothetical protein
MDVNEKYELLLTQLVFMFQAAALQQMGKLKSPVSDKIEQDLAQAQISIDMIDMLHTKTKGNLSPEEEKMFSSILRDLRLNYVDELGKQKAPPAQSSAPTEEPPKTDSDTSNR